MPRKLLWQLYPSFLIITVLSLAAMGLFASDSIRDFYLANLRDSLETSARLAAAAIDERFSPADRQEIDALLKAFGENSTRRLTVIAPDGVVIGDSQRPAETMANHADRPEVREALAGRSGYSSRFSETIGEEMMYAAAPVLKDGRVIGVVRAAKPIMAITENLSSSYLRLIIAGLIVAVAAAFISLILANQINNPIQRIRRGAEAFAKGDLGYRIRGSKIDEFIALGETMNQMAEQLDERIRAVTSQRNELEALLSGMTEAVFSVDAEGRLRLANHAFGEFFNIHPDQARDMHFSEISNHESLGRFIREALHSGEPIEGDLLIPRNDDERDVQAHGRRIKDAQGRHIGALIVLNDITRLKRLERVRKDFVANVSHELKTPITSIAGFVETLKDGAIDDPQKAREFLAIIGRHAERLNAIIEDLLTLSRLEQDEPRQAVRMEKVVLEEVVRNAVLLCEKKAAQKRIQVVPELSGRTLAVGNAALLEQAFINLIDNAIKYSDEGQTVRIVCGANGAQAFVRFIDQGHGIPRADLPRIFERFYRVDKARSRKEGGTGLGLSIVKHIAKTHGGRVGVESEPGHGSTFTFLLPRET
ncbi:MAG: HAMP domain-containing histidine kinase [Myxococcales bacterium]|nr:MAG: HAMP domain-containing histidine kinase [Myxococcales bacterium]